MKLNYDHIGKRIREKRVEIKMSQATLAELADISPQYISHIETGRKKASLGVIANVAIVLDTSVDYLLTGCAALSKSEPADSVGLLSGLTVYEKYILLDIISSVRHSLEENRWRLFE